MSSVPASPWVPHEPPAASRGVARLARPVFVLAVGAFVVLASTLAVVNRLPGHWDSINNLATGRNIAEGRGFVTDVVQQLSTPEPVPGPETVRAPGVPYLVAATFRLFGVSYGVPVLINALAVLLTALCLRQAVRETGGAWEADLAGAFVLLSHGTYEMRSLWNNGILTALTAFLLLVAVRHLAGRLGGWRLVLATSAIGALGFFMKQTFMLGAIPFGMGLLLTDGTRPVTRRVAQALAMPLLLALLTSPYWVTNLLQYGQALYSPIQGMRLPTRYDLIATDRFHRTLRFGAEPFSYAAVVAAIGLRELLVREVLHWIDLLRGIVLQNPFVFVVAVLAAFRARRFEWRLRAAMAALAIPPVFDASYWIAERRYLFALFPLVCFAAWLGVREWRVRPSGRSWRRRRIVANALAAGALLWAAVPAARQWRWELIASRFEPPGWVTAVASLPDNAIVLTGYPPEVAWYARKRAVIAPLGTREDLVRVVTHYRPGYFLDLEPEMASRRVPFAPSDLAPAAVGEGWRLHRIVMPGAQP